MKMNLIMKVFMMVKNDADDNDDNVDGEDGEVIESSVLCVTESTAGGMQLLQRRYVQLLRFKHSLLKHKCYQNSLRNTNETSSQKLGRCASRCVRSV